MFEDFPSDEDVQGFDDAMVKIYFPSKFGFLKAINGIRPGMTHGLLAPAGVGKSTLTRSIIHELAENVKIGVLLSEEKATQYAWGFKAFPSKLNKENIKFMRETTICQMNKTKQEQIEYIVTCCVAEDVKILFWDNITTGKILGDNVPPKEMANLFELLKDKCSESNIALFFVAHTKKEVRSDAQSVYSGEDMRGSAQIFLQCEYFFILQTKIIEIKEPNGNVRETRTAFVNISKHRFHSVPYNYYVLKYADRKYIGDQGVTASIIKELFSKRVK